MAPFMAWGKGVGVGVAAFMVMWYSTAPVEASPPAAEAPPPPPPPAAAYLDYNTDSSDP